MAEPGPDLDRDIGPAISRGRRLAIGLAAIALFVFVILAAVFSAG